MIARFRDFICKIQVKIQKPPLVYTNPPFFHLVPLFRQSNFIPPPKIPNFRKLIPPFKKRGSNYVYMVNFNMVIHEVLK